jgi:hypothetical protein
VRNQWLKAPQSNPPAQNLADMGWVASRTRTASAVRGTLGSGDVAGPEATVKACGVVVAMVQGHNWVPIPSNGPGMNVGTVPALPVLCRSQRPVAWLNAWPVDRAGMGRRTRSSPRSGKPTTWRRGPACFAISDAEKETHL